MKKKIPFVIGISFLFSIDLAEAASYKARCLDSADKFVRCQVDLEGETLNVKYSSEEHQNLNVTLPTNQITSFETESYRGDVNYLTNQRSEYMGVSIGYLNQQNQKW